MTIQHECGSSIDKRANKTKINKYQLVQQKKLNEVFRKWPDFYHCRKVAAQAMR
jgi:hypothetical protein